MGLFDLFKKNSEPKAELPIKSSSEQLKPNNILSISNVMLMDTRIDFTEDNSISIPFDRLVLLGGAVSSVLPSFRTITETTSVNTSGLYRLANQSAGDMLKQAKDGNFWGAFKRSNGTSKFAKLAEVGTVSETTSTVMPIDPATMMMAAALYSIEKRLDEIVEMEKQILNFLEQDKQAEIEADLKILIALINEYKYNWDNEQYVSSHHKLALDIKRTAEKNILFYQKQISEENSSKQLLVANQGVDSAEKSLEKKFKYYRLSLYIYSLASFLEVMLLGNFQEEYILQVRDNIVQHSKEYQAAYEISSQHITSLANASIEANVVEGSGNVVKAIGTFIGSIPFLKEGQVDEWLIDSGKSLQNAGRNMKKQSAAMFETIEESGTQVFVSRFEEINRIYNHTDSIYFDKEKIYLLQD